MTSKTLLTQILSCLPMPCKKIRVANRIKTVRKKLSKINKELLSYNFMITTGSDNAAVQHYDQRETTSYLRTEEIIARDEEKQGIINKLSANTNNDEITIVSIYGLGGMGKSTLAQLVYNDERLTKHHHRIWIYVSRDFNLLKIGSNIISQLSPGGGQHSGDTQQVIKSILSNLLRGKKVLIVLDDLWEEEKSELQKLVSMLHVKGSMIDVIVTTRKEDIAKKISTCEPYKLEPLKHHECWEIIKKSCTFERKSNKEKIEEIGLEIAKKCGGVALAAQAIGSVLQSVDDLSGWTKINNSDICNESFEENKILPSLRLSYERMPPQLRACFSYCAIFPKGHDFVEDDLVHQWIGLDFIKQSKGKEYIKKLLGMSFLQVSKLSLTSKWHVVRYTMHDLVHDLARLTLDDELIVFDVAPYRDKSDQKYCRYSLLRKYDGTTNLAKNLSSKMRALRFIGCGDKLDIPNSAFSFAKYLRTLDFSEYSGIMLPSSIGQLKQLRCLIAPRIQNESLPKFITELSKLQYLNINGSSQISALPESIGNLRCLKYLSLSGCSRISNLAASFDNLKCLEHLDLSHCSGIRELPASFCDLKYMVHLNMSYCSGMSELPESLGNLTNLQHLRLSKCCSLQAIPESLCGLTQLQCLDLSFCECLDRLPEAIGSLFDLHYVNISYCSGISELPDSLGSLTNLQHLEISGCRSLRTIPESLCGLTRLQYLNLSCCLSLDRLPEAIGSLEDLQYLNMSHCSSIKGLPESLMKLQNLLHLDLSRCHSLRGESSLGCLRGLTALQHLDMSSSFGDERLDVLGLSSGCMRVADFIGTLTNLEHLDLSWNSLACLPKSMGDLKSLKYLGLSGCSMHVIDFIGNLTNLEHLVLSSNFRLVCLPENMGNLKRLHKLVLRDCGGLQTLSESIGNLERLHTLDLTRCRGLKCLPESIIGALGLKSLVLEGCSNELLDQASSLVHYSKSLPLFKVRADDVNGGSNLRLLEGAHHVRELRILSLENARSLEEANNAKLVDKHSLSVLTLDWTVDAVRQVDDKDLLGELVPPSGLRVMHLQGYSSTGFPGWLMDISHHLTDLCSIDLHCLPTCSNLPPLGQLPQLKYMDLTSMPSIKIIDSEFCGGKEAFRSLTRLCISDMQGLEEWNTTYSVEDGAVKFMFPAVDELFIHRCPRLRLKPCPPTFRWCRIVRSNQVISSLEDVDKNNHLSLPCRGTNLILFIEGDYCRSLRIFHHFPALQELCIDHPYLTSLPESIQYLKSIRLLTLDGCDSMLALPEWLGDLSSLTSLHIRRCKSIKCLPPCINQLNNLQKLKISLHKELKKWCELEENKTNLAHINVEFEYIFVCSDPGPTRTIPKDFAALCLRSDNDHVGAVRRGRCPLAVGEDMAAHSDSTKSLESQEVQHHPKVCHASLLLKPTPSCSHESAPRRSRALP